MANSESNLKNLAWSVFIALSLMGILLVSQISLASPSESSEDQALQAFASMQPIDVHVHVFKSDPAFQSLLERLHLKLLNILVMDDTLSYRKELAPQISRHLALVRSSHGHIAWCTTFDPYKFNDPSLSQDSIKQIDENFAQGAVAVKIWKNVGMEIKDRDGKFIMPDDPKFEPIYKDIARHGKTLMAHLAEPDVAWDHLILPIPRGRTIRKIRSGSCTKSPGSPLSSKFCKRATAFWPRIQTFEW